MGEDRHGAAAANHRVGLLLVAHVVGDGVAPFVEHGQPDLRHGPVVEAFAAVRNSVQAASLPLAPVCQISINGSSARSPGSSPQTTAFRGFRPQPGRPSFGALASAADGDQRPVDHRARAGNPGTDRIVEPAGLGLGPAEGGFPVGRAACPTQPSPGACVGGDLRRWVVPEERPAARSTAAGERVSRARGIRIPCRDGAGPGEKQAPFSRAKRPRDAKGFDLRRTTG